MYLGSTTFQGHAAFCATWNGVGYFGSHTDKLNTFQVLIVQRDGPRHRRQHRPLQPRLQLRPGPVGDRRRQRRHRRPRRRVGDDGLFERRHGQHARLAGLARPGIVPGLEPERADLPEQRRRPRPLRDRRPVDRRRSRRDHRLDEPVVDHARPDLHDQLQGDHRRHLLDPRRRHGLLDGHPARQRHVRLAGRRHDHRQRRRPPIRAEHDPRLRDERRRRGRGDDDGDGDGSQRADASRR